MQHVEITIDPTTGLECDQDRVFEGPVVVGDSAEEPESRKGTGTADNKSKKKKSNEK